jgi:hypothetical protein
MKTSKLIFTIFLGSVFSLVLCFCFWMLSSNHNRGTMEEPHYVPFEDNFNHLVIEEGWSLTASIGEGLNLEDPLFWSGTTKIKLEELKGLMTPNGILLNQYYAGYDDENLLNKIEIKNDTLFFRQIKLAAPFKRHIRLNVITLNSVAISGESYIRLNPKRNYLSDISSENLGEFTINMNDRARTTTNGLNFEKLNVRAQDFSNLTLLSFGRVNHVSEDIKETHINSDVVLTGNALLEILDRNLFLTNYEIKDEAILVYSNSSVETAYGKKESRYSIELNKRANASSSSN